MNFLCTYSYIEKKIRDNIEFIDLLEIIDNSGMHSNHYQNLEQNISHLEIRIKSKEFDNLSRIESNKKIYNLFQDEIRSGAIHAIQIKIL
jgi:stress-induced morphogen